MIRVVLVAALIACGNTPPPPAPRVVAAPVAVPVIAPTVDERLAARSITDDDFYRSTLYSWTTPAAIAELRSTHALLVATTQSGGFVSPFNRALLLLGVTARPGAELARMLRDDPRLARRRYAWPAAFATVLGLGPRAYGNALIRIELRPEAWIGRFAPTEAEPFRFVDGAHHRIANADVLAHPERIGAIFHVRSDAYEAVKFREYVVCNPAMVASWEIATPRILTELAAERALVVDLGELPHATAPATPAWSSPAVTTLDRWHATLAFDNARYRPIARSLVHLIQTLDAYDPAGDALSVP